jgi:hypothetical protein
VDPPDTRALGQHADWPSGARVPRRAKLFTRPLVGFLSTALFGPERQTYWRRRWKAATAGQPPWPKKWPTPRPTAADLATALDQPPLLDRLPELPQPELRTLFDSLRLQWRFSSARPPSMWKPPLFADEPSDRRKEVAEVQSVPPTGQYWKKCPQVEGRALSLSARHAKLRRAGYWKTGAPDGERSGATAHEWTAPSTPIPTGQAASLRGSGDRMKEQGHLGGRHRRNRVDSTFTPRFLLTALAGGRVASRPSPQRWRPL